MTSEHRAVHRAPGPPVEPSPDAAVEADPPAQPAPGPATELELGPGTGREPETGSAPEPEPEPEPTERPVPAAVTRPAVEPTSDDAVVTPPDDAVVTPPDPAVERAPDAAAGAVPGAPRQPVSRSWRAIARALAPRPTRAQAMAGLLCALLGFAIVVQVQQNRSDGLSALRQDELVRILDEVTQRTEELEDQAAELRAQRAELATGSDTRRAAREAAAERAAQQGILAGRLPAQGPGVVLTVRDPQRQVPAIVLYNVLEELRNAGAEAVQINDLRVTASTYVVDTPDGVSVDGTLLEPPYRWIAIGDPDVIIPALNMPGGALAVVRGSGGQSEVEARSQVAVDAVREIEPPRFATPVPATEGG